MFCGERVWYIDGVPTLVDRVRRNAARCRIINDDFTTTQCYVARVGNYWAHGDSLRKAFEDAQAKVLKDSPVEDRIASFKVEFPKLSATAKCSEFYRWHHILTGSCTMGRNEFVKAHELDMDKDYTVGYFLTITANSFGGEIIKQLRELYERTMQ